MLNVRSEVQFNPNKNCCTIHIDKALPSCGGWLSDKQSPEEIKPLFDALNQIDGVVTVQFSEKYQITISKGTVFSWDKITKEACEIIDKFYQPEGL
jgi:hypothetical protein